jgi:amino acid transporter
MLSGLKRLVIGYPIPTHQLGERKLNKIRALASFSPDALSSIAYANEEIFLGLVVAGAAGLALSWKIGLAITGLMLLVALSYYQTIQSYPDGGGSYAVARRNLGLLPGLLTASSLMMGYLLTAAVSLTAGVAAIASAYPGLWSHRVTLALVFLLFIALINLRGARETGTGMSIPVYLFVFTYLAMLAYGAIRALYEGPGSLSAAPPATQPLTTFLILHAFSAGCTALTGIESISNGVPIFRPPESKNAGQTLIVMACLMGILFVGSLGLTNFLGIVAGPQETILSALARRLLGNGVAYVAVQATTLLILVVAANTSFAGFPRLTAILARDGYLPRQLTALGDRLSLDNGILLLTAGTAGLIVVFGGDSHALIPLFAVGVFLAFTLSQVGMVMHWLRERTQGWTWKAAINGFGALVTGMTVIIIGVSRFIDGAWIVIILIPLALAVFLPIRSHYRRVGEQLSLRGKFPPLQPASALRVVVPVSGVHRGIVDALSFARTLTRDVTAVYIELEPGAGKRIRDEWAQRWPEIPLKIVPSPYRSIIRPLLDFLDETDANHHDGQLAVVVLPELVPARWWQGLLHNQTAWLLKAALLYSRRHLGFQRVIIDVPFHLQR